MVQEYRILTNDDSVWLDMLDDVSIEHAWDIDVYNATEKLKYMAEEYSVAKDLIEQFGCNLVVETNMEYYPY